MLINMSQILKHGVGLSGGTRPASRWWKASRHDIHRSRTYYFFNVRSYCSLQYEVHYGWTPRTQRECLQAASLLTSNFPGKPYKKTLRFPIKPGCLAHSSNVRTKVRTGNAICKNCHQTGVFTSLTPQSTTKPNGEGSACLTS